MSCHPLWDACRRMPHALAITLACGSAATSFGDTYVVTNGACDGAGSLRAAIEAANTNPGHDTITIAAGLEIFAGEFDCDTPQTHSYEYFLIQATDSVTIEGNGASIVGSIHWVTSGGLDTPIDSCPTRPGSTDIYVSQTPGFIKVGADDVDNTGLEVLVRGLNLYEVMAVARVEKQAALVLEDVTAERVLGQFAGQTTACNVPAIAVREGGDLTIRRNDWDTVINWGDTGLFYARDTAIAPVDGPLGDLLIEDSRFVNVYGDGLLWWNGAAGSRADIVSTRFIEAGGVLADGEGTTNIVNSFIAMDPYDDVPTGHRIANLSSGGMNITASTILAGDPSCFEACQTQDSPGLLVRFRASNDGSGLINLAGSAIAFNFPTLEPGGRVLDNLTAGGIHGTAGGFSADAFTWVRPVQGQTAADLEAIAGSALLTSEPALPLEYIFGSYHLWGTPLAGTAKNPGLLLHAIPDAGSGGVNELMHPLTGQPITTDVYGLPRTDTNNRRSIGAIEPDSCPADINRDGIVDGRDLAFVLGYWGSCFECPADINQDSTVNSGDLGMLIAAWGACP